MLRLSGCAKGIQSTDISMGWCTIACAIDRCLQSWFSFGLCRVGDQSWCGLFHQDPVCPPGCFSHLRNTLLVVPIVLSPDTVLNTWNIQILKDTGVMEIWSHTKSERVSKLSALNNAWVPSVLRVLCPWDHQQHLPRCGHCWRASLCLSSAS